MWRSPLLAHSQGQISSLRRSAWNAGVGGMSGTLLVIGVAVSAMASSWLGTEDSRKTTKGTTPGETQLEQQNPQDTKHQPTMTFASHSSSLMNSWLSIASLKTLLAIRTPVGMDRIVASASTTYMESSTSASLPSQASPVPKAEMAVTQSQQQPRPVTVTKRNTIRKLRETSSRQSLEDKYTVHWKQVLGDGAYGAVYLGSRKNKKGKKKKKKKRNKDNDDEEERLVAIKQISKNYTDNVGFQREMTALLHLKKAGGHPHICSMHDHFDEGNHYYVVLDLIQGGELFEHLIANGPFSEHDASRLVREVASALAFLHGVGIVHGDMKPENLMLSTSDPLDAAVKIVDFGCAQVTAPPDASSLLSLREEEQPTAVKKDADDEEENPRQKRVSTTVAYCPPEVLDHWNDDNNGKTGVAGGGIVQGKLEPAMDMWALGIILYIMLVGVHPFDLDNTGDDDALMERVRSRTLPPLRNSKLTAHLSDSALDIIERLIMADPEKRITALEMLDHPWVNGETANRNKIADSDTKLTMKLQTKVFEYIVDWSDNEDTLGDAVERKTSLVERAFHKLHTMHELPEKETGGNDSDGRHHGHDGGGGSDDDDDDEDGHKGDKHASALSLSGFSDLLSENMKNRYFPTGHAVYHEGDVGNHMYFINSGVVEIVTKDGSCATRGPGNFFGEGALLNPHKSRSATIRCKTPVHAMEISREYFEKYLANSDSGLFLRLREKDKIRKRNRAKTILRLQKNLVEREFKKGEILFQAGDPGDSLFLVEKGKVDILVHGKRVLSATPGNVCGESSVLTPHSNRNCTAVCASKQGCTTHQMLGRDFRLLAEHSPDVYDSIRDLSLRRDFKKAVVHYLQKSFPYDKPREAFDALCPAESDSIDMETMGKLMRAMNPQYTDAEIQDYMRTIDLRNTGKVHFEDFEKVFIADIRKSAAI